MTFKSALFGLVLIFVGTSAAQAQSIHRLVQGTKLTGNVEFGRFHVALPPGDWIVIGAMLDKGQMLTGGQSIPLARAALAQVEKGTLVGLVEIFGSPDSQLVTWAPDPECRREDFWLVEADRNFNQGEQDCRIVGHMTRNWVAATTWPESDKQAMAWLQENNIRRPQQMMKSTYRRVRTSDVLSVTYSINPEYFGQRPPASPAWPTSDWHKTAYPQKPERKAFAESWLAWSETMQPIFVDGFRNRLTASAPAFPFTPGEAAPALAAPQAAASVLKPGTRFETSNGEFRVERIDGSVVHMVNKANQPSTWLPRGLMPIGTETTFDRLAAEALFPMKIGNKVTFEQKAASGDNAWRHVLEVVRAEILTIGESKYPTWVVDARTEALNPGQGGFARKRTVWFAPQPGWILRMREEQLAGPPQRMNNWDVVKIVPPG